MNIDKANLSYFDVRKKIEKTIHECEYAIAEYCKILDTSEDPEVQLNISETIDSYFYMLDKSKADLNYLKECITQ